jgi:hypothetical protein
MNWLSLLLFGVKIVGALAVFLQRRQIINEAQTAMVAAAMKEQLRVLGVANEARTVQHQRNLAVPDTDKLPDDGFRRD